MILRHCLIIAGMLSLTQIPALAASFDCGKAGNTLEHTICDDAFLNAADGQMGDLYRELRTSLAKPQQDELKQEQRDWLKQRTKFCTADDAVCLLSMYQQRIADLRGAVNEGLAVEKLADFPRLGRFHHHDAGFDAV